MEKVWIIRFDDVVEFETFYHKTEVFSTYERAKKRFDKIVANAKSDDSWGVGWEVKEDEKSYETYPQGYWGTNHYAVYLEEFIVQ